MLNYSKEKYLKFLHNLCRENCEDDGCILKAFLTRMQPDIRMLVQLKCLQYFAEDQKEKLSREELMKRWVSEGLAKKFSEIYEQNKAKKEIDKIDVKEIYLSLKKGAKSEY